MKRGRPMISEPRTFIFRLRINEDEKKQLDFISKELNKTKSEVIRDLIRKESYLLYYGHN